MRTAFIKSYNSNSEEKGNGDHKLEGDFDFSEYSIKVLAENLSTGTVRHTNSCYFTMVALDEHHKPVTIKPLICTTEEQERRFKEAELRKKMRMELAEKEKAFAIKHD